MYREGTERIYMNDCGRFEMENGHELHCGEVVQLHEKGCQVPGRVEIRPDGRYYLYPAGIDLADGMHVLRVEE